MTFSEAQAHLDRLGVDAMKHLAPTLTRIEAICEALNHPERAVPAIHITGTNGKTSTAAICTSLLGATGLSVGTYTSPHLVSVTERISLGGQPISEEEFGEVFAHLQPFLQLTEERLGETLSYFEVLTAMFFLWAAEKPVDALVVEVGLGGRWDATNVVPAQVAAITNVGFDHMQLLGKDRPTIAAEKSGIIKEGSLAVTGERTPDVLAVIEAEARTNGVDLSVFERDFHLRDNRLAVGGRYLSLSVGTRSYEDLFLPLHGAHQGVNAAVALEAVTRFLPGRELDEDVVAEGFATARVPGRLEIVRQGTATTATTLLDVAHNPDGMSALVTSLIEAFAFEKVHLVLGILADKDYEGMLRELGRLDARLIVTEAASVRSVPAPELGEAAERLGLEATVIDDVPSAIRQAVRDAGPGDLICITGSHYVVGEARGHLVRS